MATFQPQPVQTTAAPAFDEAEATEAAKKKSVPEFKAALNAGAETQGLKAALVERLVATQRAAARMQPAAQTAVPQLSAAHAQWKAEMDAQMSIAALEKLDAKLTLNQVGKVQMVEQVGPQTREAINLLFHAAFSAAGIQFDPDAAFLVGDLAKLCGPTTKMSLPTLVELIYCAYVIADREESAIAMRSRSDRPGRAATACAPATAVASSSAACMSSGWPAPRRTADCAAERESAAARRPGRAPPTARGSPRASHS